MKYNKCWLNYSRVPGLEGNELLKNVSVMTRGQMIERAVDELKKGIREITGMELNVRYEESLPSHSHGIVLALFEGELANRLSSLFKLSREGFVILTLEDQIYITGLTESGILYGTFEFLKKLQLQEDVRTFSVVENPKMNLRMINHWDNIDGSIERGYAGESFFFQENRVIVNQRTEDYARLMASVAINAVVINNVNVRGKATDLITEEYLSELKRISDIFVSYGIKLFLSVNFAAPIELGELPLADPLDERVAMWWKDAAEVIYNRIPDFGGFLVKADSEGRPGPFTYTRTHADGANVLARAIAPFGGIVIWRCFVYNCKQDWRNKKMDRARAAFDHFIGLDGSFDDNVILQIKNGPMDFQVREPVSPLLGGLKQTNQILEVQIAQEYTGQQKHVCYLIPMWKEILKFNTYANRKDTTVEDIVSGQAFNQVNCGMAAVSNTGNDVNWTGHDLAAANLYGYGRLCWNPSLSSEQIAKDWIKRTFSFDSVVVEAITEILLDSWPVYEKYTSPLGIGWMVNPGHHYGPNIDGYEYDKWGTYHRADCHGIGVDRTPKGTGFTRQYRGPNVSMYESVKDCPEELLLFFHKISYDFVLKSGKTLIQHIYDSHFEGVQAVEEMIKKWKMLKDKVTQDVFERISERFEMQLESAIEWRDRVNTYFHRMSGIDDEKGRTIY